VRLGWDKLTTVQQWVCEQVLGIEPATEDEKPQPRHTQADKWAMKYETAKQFHEREGHLRVPRKHVKTTWSTAMETSVRRSGRSSWGLVGNQRSRAATLSPERVEQLSALGMRWAQFASPGALVADASWWCHGNARTGGQGRTVWED
jgi:hypothetical protein